MELKKYVFFKIRIADVSFWLLLRYIQEQLVCRFIAESIGQAQIVSVRYPILTYRFGIVGLKKSFSLKIIKADELFWLLLRYIQEQLVCRFIAERHFQPLRS